MLAAVGHDLEIRVDDYAIELDRAALHVSARVEAASLRVVEAVEGRRRHPGELSSKDKAQIDATIADQVLRAAQYPTISFQSTGIESGVDRFRVGGRLTLRGVTRESTFVVLQRDGELSAQVIVHQPDFAIAPYRALGGALRVHPDVTIEFHARIQAASEDT